MEIEFIAKDKNGNRARGHTAQEAVLRFLSNFKSRKLYVAEYRDGSHVQIIGGTGDEAENCFYRAFDSRADAKYFAEAS